MLGDVSTDDFICVVNSVLKRKNQHSIIQDEFLQKGQKGGRRWLVQNFLPFFTLIYNCSDKLHDSRLMTSAVAQFDDYP